MSNGGQLEGRPASRRHVPCDWNPNFPHALVGCRCRSHFHFTRDHTVATVVSLDTNEFQLTGMFDG